METKHLKLNNNNFVQNNSAKNIISTNLLKFFSQQLYFRGLFDLMLV